MCCLAGGGERTFEEDVACVFGRLDSEEVPAEGAYSTGGGGFDAARTDVEGVHLDSVHCVFEAGAEA